MTTTRRTPSNTEIEQTGNSATTGYESELWQMADALRGQYGCCRVQACRPRPHLPQVHL